MNNNVFIRSTKCSLKFNNKIKKDELKIVVDEYSRCLQLYINDLWNKYQSGTKIKSRFLKEDQLSIETWMTARLKNSCINHASSVIRSRIEQIKERKKTLDDILDQETYKELTKKQKEYKVILIKSIDKMNTNPPLIKNKEMRIDSKNSLIDNTQVKEFDLSVELLCLGINNIQLLTKKHKQFNKLYDKGKMLKGITITNSYIQFNFEYSKNKNCNNKQLGVDIGINTCFTSSDNQRYSANDKHKEYHTIMKELLPKRKGSKNFTRKLKERDNLVGYAIKQIPWEELNTICFENIKNMRKGKNVEKLRRHWNYNFILRSLNNYAQQHDVRVELRNPMYTSRRCSKCGYVEDNNRDNEQFLCLNCSYAANSDYNASLNINDNQLFPLNKKDIPGNKKFFWNSTHIVCAVGNLKLPVSKEK